MRRVVWLIFWICQVAGVVCLLGGESFAITPIGYSCRAFSFWILEPGFILMGSFVEATLFHSRVTLEQQMWLGVFLAIAVNALCLSAVMRLASAVRRRRTAS